MSSARPLIRPAPRSAMFFPLVVLAAVLPGLYALNRSDLTPPGPWWGVRTLAVLDGYVVDQSPTAAGLTVAEARAYLDVAYQPPLYAWLAAIGLAGTPRRSPWACALPSYVAGMLVVILVYVHGRLWRGPGIGLAAAILTGFNRQLLTAVQQASPTTLGLAATIAALAAYGRHLRDAPTASDGRPWGGGARWLALGGLALGLGLLSSGWFALFALPVALLHQAYMVADRSSDDRPFGKRWKLGWRDNPSLVAGAFVFAIGLLVAGPWHLRMALAHGQAFLHASFAPPDPRGGEIPGLLSRLLELAPATMPLGLYAAVNAIRRALVTEVEDPPTVGGVFWTLWLAVAAVAPIVWPTGPRSTFDLFLLIPLNLLAAQAMTELADRTIPIRRLTVLAPVTAVCIAWSISGNLRGAVSDLARGRADSGTGLGLHFALDLLIAVVLLSRGLERWAHRRDDRQRAVLAGFLVAVVTTTVAGGIAKASQTHPTTRDDLDLREILLRRHAAKPFREVDVIGPDPRTPELAVDSGRLRFVLRSALPRITPKSLATTDELLSLPAPKGARLVILLATEQRLSYPVQSKLGLETIFPGSSGLDAFATSHTPARK